MKKKILMSLVLLTIAGAGMVFAQSNSLTGQWYIRIGNESAEAYDFRSDGALHVGGDAMGISYTVSGNTITTYFGGSLLMGTARFAVSGSGANATLRITNASETSGIENGTYSRSAASGNSNANAINGKWYVRIANQSAEIYDFRSDRALLVAGDVSGISFEVSGNTITTTYSGIFMGTARFSIAGTGSNARLTISNASENSGLVDGTYYR